MVELKYNGNFVNKAWTNRMECFRKSKALPLWVESFGDIFDNNYAYKDLIK